MRLSKYAQVLLLSPITGSLAVCCLGVAVCGAFLVQGRRVDHARTAIRESDRRVLASIRTSLPIPDDPRTGHPTIARHVAPLETHPVVYPGKPPRIHRTVPAAAPVFHASLTDDERDFLKQLAGLPAHDVLRSNRFRAFVDMVTPYTPFHYGVDVPLTQAIEAVLAGSQDAVQIREGRYLLLSNETGRAASRGFLWVDLQDGTAVGGIFFHPSNGEPTPTLTLFSKQVTSDSIHMGQFPAEFVTDLAQWTTAASIRPVATRYFVNAANRKSVLPHEENFCKAVEGETAPAKETCERMNADAAELDTAAAIFLGRAHYASNATMPGIAARPE